MNERNIKCLTAVTAGIFLGSLQLSCVTNRTFEESQERPTRSTSKTSVKS